MLLQSKEFKDWNKSNCIKMLKLKILITKLDLRLKDN